MRSKIREVRYGVVLGGSSVNNQRERQMVRPMKATVTSLPKWLGAGGMIDQMPSSLDIGWGGAPIHCCRIKFPRFHRSWAHGQSQIRCSGVSFGSPHLGHFGLMFWSHPCRMALEGTCPIRIRHLDSTRAGGIRDKVMRALAIFHSSVDGVIVKELCFQTPGSVVTGLSIGKHDL